MRIRYECGICHNFSEDRAEIAACEARGRQRAYPVGMIFGNAGCKDALYGGITFAIAINNLWEGHSWEPDRWACRDNGFGDSVGDEVCGGGPVLLVSPDPRHPTFRRMVAFLRLHPIPITVYDEETQEAIPLAAFLAKHGVTLDDLPPYQLPPARRSVPALRPPNPHALPPETYRILGLAVTDADEPQPPAGAAEASAAAAPAVADHVEPKRLDASPDAMSAPVPSAAPVDAGKCDPVTGDLFSAAPEREEPAITAPPPYPVYVTDGLNPDTGIRESRMESEAANRALLNWDGYIEPDGAFHGTRPRILMYYLGSFNPHEDWADIYLRDDPVAHDRAKDRLVDQRGWVSLTFYLGGRRLRRIESILGLPPKPTRAQMNMLEHIWRVRGLPLDDLSRTMALLRPGTDAAGASGQGDTAL